MNQPAGFFQLRCFKHDIVFALFFKLRLGNLANQPSFLDNAEPVPHQVEFRQDMAGDDKGHAQLLVEPLHQLAEFLDSDRIQAIDRFVQYHQVRSGKKRNSQTQPLFHPE